MVCLMRKRYLSPQFTWRSRHDEKRRNRTVMTLQTQKRRMSWDKFQKGFNVRTEKGIPCGGAWAAEKGKYWAVCWRIPWTSIHCSPGSEGRKEVTLHDPMLPVCPTGRNSRWSVDGIPFSWLLWVDLCSWWCRSLLPRLVPFVFATI